jgi:hypothetical protein
VCGAYTLLIFGVADRYGTKICILSTGLKNCSYSKSIHGTFKRSCLSPSYSSDFNPSAFYLWAGIKENIQIKHLT